ncbi:MAG: hypothetical protein JKY87_02810 [Mariprofundus sp.]|nr:hypothetical protein [Mariprofundus sp.]
MNISLTKQELVILLRLANIGNWVMFAELDDEDADPVAMEHKIVMQKLFAAAHEARMGDVVSFDPSLNEYFETIAFEDDYLTYVHEYTVKQLSEELPDQLAVRDLIDQVGEETFENMDRLERASKLQQLAFMYEEEFEQHGLSRLHLLNVSNHNQRRKD